MYANETNTGFIKVYPNKDAVKQMILQNVRTNSSLEHHTRSVIQPEEAISQPHKARLSSGKDSEDFYTLLLMLILLCAEDDNCEVLFTLILGALFLD